MFFVQDQQPTRRKKGESFLKDIISEKQHKNVQYEKDQSKKKKQQDYDGLGLDFCFFFLFS